jgi:hypothetical protein
MDEQTLPTEDKQSQPEEDYLKRLQRGIDRRQQELSRTATTLAKNARNLGLSSAVTKVSLVLLGAFTATKAVGDQLFGSGNTRSLVVYALAGTLTATFAGLEAAFNWDRRSVGLGALAAACLAAMRDVDTQYRSSVLAQDREEAARQVLQVQDENLKYVQTESTKLGVNITFTLYPPSDSAPPPYPA